jgi:Xaa-Pro aminopeptidase
MLEDVLRINPDNQQAAEIKDEIEEYIKEESKKHNKQNNSQRVLPKKSFSKTYTSWKDNISNFFTNREDNYDAKMMKKVKKLIQKGDNIAFEITPRYQGYWTQIVRTVCLGEKNDEAQFLHDLIVKTIDETVKLLKPGVPLKDVIKFMWDYIEKAGYIPSLPCGHVCAVDLNEGRVDPESDVMLTDGMAVIIHPTILAPGLETSIFWGETYLVTPNGGECLMHTSKDLLVV